MRLHLNAPYPMRFLCVAMVCSVAACSDAGEVPTEADKSSPSVESAAAFPIISTAPPDSWRMRQMSERRSVDYVAILTTERPVSHHRYLYERRRSGDWIADVYRRGDGTQEEISYFNVKTGAVVGVGRDAKGEITKLGVAQRDDYQWDRRHPTGEHATHLGERCAVWRERPSGPGIHALRESCITDDGIELWSRARFADGRLLGSSVAVSSLSRRRVDPSEARPPKEAFDWAYWRARIASSRVAKGSVPPDHSVWFEAPREAKRGFAVVERYKGNWRSEHSRRWFEGGGSHDYAFQAPGVTLNASSGLRELTVYLDIRPLLWRPDPSMILRGDALTVLGRRCNWLSPSKPPHHLWWKDCWTDDNFVLARQRGNSRANYSVKVAAVRLDNAPPPTAELEPSPEIFAWARKLSE